MSLNLSRMIEILLLALGIREQALEIFACGRILLCWENGI
jgi:hypothetical protein